MLLPDDRATDLRQKTELFVYKVTTYFTLKYFTPESKPAARRQKIGGGAKKESAARRGWRRMLQQFS